MPLPDFTPEQRAANLEKAAAVRKARAALRKDLGAGKITLAEIFTRADHDDVAGKTQVMMLLTAMPRIGKIKASAILDELDIHHGRTARSLGPNQRQKLIERFRSN
ncbi:integration host factor [Rhodococcus hoagii]|nr:integration host factor [Prescottella equi]